jgi:hypothetical protein
MADKREIDTRCTNQQRKEDEPTAHETRGTEILRELPPQTALVLAAQAGDQTAFEMLVKAYQRELLVYCYRMLGSFNDAEDLVQETLLRAWEKRATLTSPGSYRAWLYRIATNLCLDRLRSAPRRSLPPQTHPVGDPDSLPRNQCGSRYGWSHSLTRCSPINRPTRKPTRRGASKRRWLS